jgi:hypothetical protein
MAFNLRNRSFLKDLDFTPDELRFPTLAFRACPPRSSFETRRIDEST